MTMREVECKVLEVDVGQLKRKLKQLHARHISTKRLVAVHLDTRDRFFSKKHWLVRLRSDGGPAVLTLKMRSSKKAGLKSADEREITLSGFKSSLRVLRKMGLEPVRTLTKKRESYMLGDVRLEIDKYLKELSHIPPFLEIEADSRRKVLWAARKLGYSARDLKAYDTHDLITHYSK
ncbi:MAG: class IV adenylate cyclase [Candidatus Micrarchaeia archaeon]